MKEVGIRVTSGLIMAVGYMLIVTLQGFFYVHLFLLGAALVYLGTREYFKLFFHDEVNHVIRIVVTTAGILITFCIYLLSLKGAHYLPNFAGMPRWLMSMTRVASPDIVMAICFLMVTFLFIYHIVTDQIELAGRKIALSAFCIVYLSLPLSILFLLRGQTYGVFNIWFLTWIVVMSDTVAFFFGRSMGKHKVKWKISPSKTWEGYIGGLLGTVALTFVFYELFSRVAAAPHYGFMKLLVLSVVFYLLGVLGDLAESLLKRSQAVKDTGNLIPGHGGVLDRIDSMLFALPAFYLAQKLFL